MLKYKDWGYREFDPKNATRHSLWFNRELMKQSPALRDVVKMVNQKMDWKVESMAGYGRISTD